MLEIRNADKSYGSNQVLHDVSFTAHRGRLTGFVGGNGAGKTTSMRIILGVLSPDAGTVTINGETLTPTSRLRFGYMPEERGLYPKMSAVSQVTYLARLHGIPRAQAAERARRLLERLGLGERATSSLESLSLGNQQRVQIAAALVHEPDILILDEPFSGLDPNAVDLVLDVLTEHARAGAVVLFSSHQLDVVERLCDDIVIIDSGRIVAAGDTLELRERFAGSRHELVAGTDVRILHTLPGIEIDAEETGDDPHRMVFRASDEDAQTVLARAVAQGPVRSFSPRLPSLSEIFKDITAQGGRLPDTPASPTGDARTTDTPEDASTTVPTTTSEVRR